MQVSCHNIFFWSDLPVKENHPLTRHIWESYIEICEDIRHTEGNNVLYDKRKETVERLLGAAKEHHGFRYTQLIGKARMNIKTGFTFACLNLKKLAQMLSLRGDNGGFHAMLYSFLRLFFKNVFSSA